MDQDLFRQLLQTPHPGSASTLGSASRSRGSFLAVPGKSKTVDASHSAFKPRKVKKSTDSKYRDRATERRTGEGNDFAHVEAVLEEFERSAVNAEDKTEVEEKRRYLGGDGDHSVLVKGLDFALLEQNKAKAALSTDDVDALEEAFREGSSHIPATVPKKRTREDIVRELKEKREQKTGPNTLLAKTTDEEFRSREDAKQKGKFKPIGFKPIGSATEGKKSKVDGTGRKKKRKVEEGRKPEVESKAAKEQGTMPPPPLPSKSTELEIPVEQAKPIDDDFDIFAGAGEYEGIDDGDDDDDDHKREVSNTQDAADEGTSSTMPRRWIDTGEPEPPAPQSYLPTFTPNTKDPTSDSLPEKVLNEDAEMEEGQPMRLVPLESSALPSIKDFLAMDKAAGSHGKKRKKKDKKAGGGGDNEEDDDSSSKKKSAEAKIDRDYKRLKSYTDKKALLGTK